MASLKKHFYIFLNETYTFFAIRPFIKELLCFQTIPSFFGFYITKANNGIKGTAIGNLRWKQTLLNATVFNLNLLLMPLWAPFVRYSLIKESRKLQSDNSQRQDMETALHECGSPGSLHVCNLYKIITYICPKRSSIKAWIKRIIFLWCLVHNTAEGLRNMLFVKVFPESFPLYFRHSFECVPAILRTNSRNLYQTTACWGWHFSLPCYCVPKKRTLRIEAKFIG